MAYSFGDRTIKCGCSYKLLICKSDASYNTIWINFGIVGSRNFKVGDLIQIDKITSSDFQDNYYPSPPLLRIIILNAVI